MSLNNNFQYSLILSSDWIESNNDKKVTYHINNITFYPNYKFNTNQRTEGKLINYYCSNKNKTEKRKFLNIYPHILNSLIKNNVPKRNIKQHLIYVYRDVGIYLYIIHRHSIYTNQLQISPQILIQL